MNFYKELMIILCEMMLSIFIAIFGYVLWNNFDSKKYMETINYDNTYEVEVAYEDNCLMVHNVSRKDNNKDLMFKVNRFDSNLKNDDIILLIDGKEYDLSNLDYTVDDLYIYYIIDNISFNEYETKVYDAKVLSKSYDVIDSLNYEFVTEI